MNKVKISIVLMCLCTLLISNVSIAQETAEKESKISFDFGTDLMSRYVWRGSQLGGNSPSLQPGMSVGFAGLEFGAWGAYSLGGVNAGQEFDLYLSYTFLNDMLSVTVTDYFLPMEGTDYNYVKWDDDQTGHVLEGTLAFNGTENLPISFLAAVNFYGADYRKANGDLQYSNYFELGYTFDVNNISCNAFVGGTLSNPDLDKGEAGFYGEGPGILNLGLTASKEIEITDKFSLPLTASFITNPQREQVFFVFGFTF